MQELLGPKRNLNAHVNKQIIYMKKFLTIVVLLMVILQFTACDDIDILSPPGPAGMSAYKEWVKAVESGEVSWTSGTDLSNFFKFLKGEKGDAGANAFDSWKDYIKTGTVDDPHKPGSKWDPNKNKESDFYYFISGAKGDAGLTPHINAAGNWQIGSIDTGIPAKGQPGTPGTPGQPGQPGADGSKVKINDQGNWEIDGTDTGISSKGKDGLSGTDGKSAYEIWVEQVEAGKIKDKDGNTWPPSHITLGDFWLYLSGAAVVEKELTPLKHIKNEVDPTDENFVLFDFETDPGAEVTMQFGKIVVKGTADGAGKCTLRFPDSTTGDSAVLVKALMAGKAESENLLLIVRMQLPTLILAAEAIWLDKNDNPLPAPSGEYRPNYPIPYISLLEGGSKGHKVKIPVTMKNVQAVYVSNIDWVNFDFMLKNDDDDFSTGYLLITRDEFARSPTEYDDGTILIQLAGKHDNVKFIKIRINAPY